MTDIFKARRFKAGKEPKQNVVLTIREAVVGTLQSFVVFSGLPKASKSTYIAGAVASAYVPFDVFKIKINLPDDRKQILYVDTESSEYDFYRQIAKIKDQMLRNSLPNDLIPIACREDDPEMLLQLIEWYVQHYPACSMVVIDGLLDLVYNYNDERESRKIMNWLKRLTKVYNLCIVCVLHLSKGTGNTLGHLGSLADRYAQSTVEIVKDLNTKQFVLKPKFLRSAADFEPVAINFINGKWIIQDYIVPDEPIAVKKKKEK